MAGVDIEAGPDGRGLETLSDDDAQHAIRYASWKINGFLDWFEPLFRTHRGTSIDLIEAEIRWERGEPTYRAIQELAFDHPELEYCAYMRCAARERATSDSERTWTEQQVCELFSKILRYRRFSRQRSLHAQHWGDGAAFSGPVSNRHWPSMMDTPLSPRLAPLPSSR